MMLDPGSRRTVLAIMNTGKESMQGYVEQSSCSCDNGLTTSFWTTITSGVLINNEFKSVKLTFILSLSTYFLIKICFIKVCTLLMILNQFLVCHVKQFMRHFRILKELGMSFKKDITLLYNQFIKQRNLKWEKKYLAFSYAVQNCISCLLPQESGLDNKAFQLCLSLYGYFIFIGYTRLLYQITTAQRKRNQQKQIPLKNNKF